MNGSKNRWRRLFAGVSIAGTAYLIVEIILQLFGTTICRTEGCAIVAQHTRFGDLSILFIGLGVFAFVSTLSVLTLRGERPELDRLLNLVLVVSLAAEGFFSGYQAFHIYVPCFYCLTILGFIVVLALLRMLSGHCEIIAGFASFAAVLSLFYLVLPAGGSVAVPAEQKLVLFYSPDCKHCAEILKEMQERKIAVAHREAREYSGLLKAVGIEHVPTLLVNGPYEKIFLTGKDAIRRYLFCEPKEAARKKPAASAKTPPRRQSAAPAGPIDLLAPLGAPQQILNPPADQGLCQEDQKCE